MSELDPMPETDPMARSEGDQHRTSAPPHFLTLLAGGSPEPATGRLRSRPDREQDLPHRSDLWERLTDGIVELRKRREVTAHRPAGPADPESRLAAMARRAAERAGHPLA